MDSEELRITICGSVFILAVAAVLITGLLVDPGKYTRCVSAAGDDKTLVAQCNELLK